jgi:hypothetical protein
MGNRIPKGVVGSSDASLGEQWWLIEGAVVAHWGSSGSSLGEQWLHILGSSGGSFGSSGVSLVVTPDCETAVLDSNPAISLAYSGLPVLRWAAIWDGTSL